MEKKTALYCAVGASATVITGVGVYYWLKKRNRSKKK